MLRRLCVCFIDEAVPYNIVWEQAGFWSGLLVWVPALPAQHPDTPSVENMCAILCDRHRSGRRRRAHAS